MHDKKTNPRIWQPRLPQGMQHTWCGNAMNAKTLHSSANSFFLCSQGSPSLSLSPSLTVRALELEASAEMLLKEGRELYSSESSPRWTW